MSSTEEMKEMVECSSIVIQTKSPKQKSKHDLLLKKELAMKYNPVNLRN